MRRENKIRKGGVADGTMNHLQVLLYISKINRWNWKTLQLRYNNENGVVTNATDNSLNYLKLDDEQQSCHMIFLNQEVTEDIGDAQYVYDQSNLLPDGHQ